MELPIWAWILVGGMSLPLIALLICASAKTRKGARESSEENEPPSDKPSFQCVGMGSCCDGANCSACPYGPERDC